MSAVSGLFDQWSKWASVPQDALKRWEGWVGQQLDRGVRSEGFLGVAGKAMERSLVVKHRLDRVQEEWLHSLRLPTLGDLQTAFERVDGLERQLLGLRDQLDDAAAERQVLLSRLAHLEAGQQALAARQTPTAAAPEAPAAAAPEAPSEAPARKATRTPARKAQTKPEQA